MNRCNRFTIIAASVLMLIALLPARASDDLARAEISAVLMQWTADFNGGRGDKICDLFARELRADFRGHPERDYDAQCDLLKRSLADATRTYFYAHTIKEILVWGDVAVVRLTWTLTVRQRDAARESISTEPGLDIFRRESDGSWRIVRYMAFED